jgi:hypothetical protein
MFQMPGAFHQDRILAGVSALFGRSGLSGPGWAVFPECSHSRGFGFMHLQAFQLFQLFDRSRLLAFQLFQPFPTFFGFVLVSVGAALGGSDI